MKLINIKKVYYNKNNIVEALKCINLEINKNVQILLITHDIALAERYTDRILMIEDGKIIDDKIINQNNINQHIKNAPHSRCI